MRARWQHICWIVNTCLEVDGDFAEFGVWQGTTFLPMAECGAKVGKVSHAVDSFRGCAAPTERDVAPDGVCRYGEGAFSVGGSRLFRQLTRPLYDAGAVVIWEGWIPGILAEMAPKVDALAFVHVDLDQFDPTLATLRWVWPRLSSGGVVCIHDWFEDRDYLATGAVKQWIREQGVCSEGTLPSRHIWFRKEG